MAKKPSYSDLLKDPRWQRKRLEILDRDGWTCRECSSREKTLHVHHRSYDGRKPWEYEEDLLLTLCEDCHGSVTEAAKALKQVLSEIWPGDLEVVLGFAAALLATKRGGRQEIGSLCQATGAAAYYGLLPDEVMASSENGSVDAQRLELVGAARSTAFVDARLMGIESIIGKRGEGK